MFTITCFISILYTKENSNLSINILATIFSIAMISSVIFN